MVAQSFRLLLPRLGREIATTCYFKAAERILVSTDSMRVVASNPELGQRTLRTVQHRFDLTCMADHTGTDEVRFVSKLRRSQYEQMFSALPPIAGIPSRGR